MILLCVISTQDNKYIELVRSKPTTTNMWEKRINKCANAQTTMCTQSTGNNVYTVQKQQCDHDGRSTSRTFVRLFV